MNYERPLIHVETGLRSQLKLREHESEEFKKLNALESASNTSHVLYFE